MIDWEIVKDWAPIIISAAAIIISLVTLYVTHLRGPNIRLADSGDRLIPIEEYIRSEGRSAAIRLNLLFMNMGNRSGILFEYSISGPDYIRYHQYEYEEPETILPSIIQSGDGIYVTPSITLQLPSELNWEDFLETKKYIEVEVRFKTNKTFP